MSDAIRLRDMLVSIKDIERYTTGGRQIFDHNELIQSWVVHRLLIIGEAASQLSPELREKYPDIPFRRIVGMRNIMIHAYHQVDLDVVWSVVEQELSDLHRKIENVINTDFPVLPGGMDSPTPATPPEKP